MDSITNGKNKNIIIMKIVSIHYIEDSNGIRTLLNETESSYTSGVNQDIEIEIVHDPDSSIGHPLPRPKTAPNF